MLAASPTTLPLFLALSACKGPAVLSGPPPLSAQTQTVLHAVTAELNLIWIYNKTMAAYSGLRPDLAPLLAEHQAHLARLLTTLDVLSDGRLKVGRPLPPGWPAPVPRC